MKDSQKKVLQFPEPLEELGAQPIICQIGPERFAIHYRIEDLPPAAPLLPWRRDKKATPNFGPCNFARTER